MASQPKPAFYIAVGVVVVALIGFAMYRSDVVAPKAPPKPQAGDQDLKRELEKEIEKSDQPKLTVDKFKEIHGGQLPPVTAVSSYQEMENNTVRFAMNVWAGWAPIILANE